MRSTKRRAIEKHLAGDGRAISWRETRKRQKGHALAAAAFADKRNALATSDAKGNAPQDGRRIGARPEFKAKVFDFEKQSSA